MKDPLLYIEVPFLCIVLLFSGSLSIYLCPLVMSNLALSYPVQFAQLGARLLAKKIDAFKH